MRSPTLFCCCLGLFLASDILGPDAIACKYTVRDVAFVELGGPQYRLYLYVDNQSPKQIAEQLHHTAQRALADSNVYAEVVTVDQNLSDEHLERLRSLSVVAYPCAVLVSPTGRLKKISLPPPSEGDFEAIGQTFATIVESPMRDEIMETLPNAHSVVLIIESDNQEQNELATTMANGAIERIVATFPDLPKAIDGPPVLMRLTPEQAKQEPMLLWGLDADSTTDETQIAMLFGRGRSLGTVAKVSEVNERDLIRTLALVGLDCECELDRSWMQAPMIPHRWTETDESRAAQALGFDPGHPLVKVEISGILSRGPSSVGGNRQPPEDIILPGLQIIELDFGDETDVAAPDKDLVAETALPSTTADDALTDSVAESPIVAEPNERSVANTERPTSTVTSESSTTDTTVAEESKGGGGTQMVLSATLIGLAALGLLGVALIVLSGRRGGS